MPDLSHLRIGDAVLIARGQNNVQSPGNVVHVGTRLLTVAYGDGILVREKFRRESGANNGQYAYPKITTAEAVEEERQLTELADKLRRHGFMPTIALQGLISIDQLQRILAILEEE